MHFFSFSSIFFHAPGVINCVFYQAEKFSEVDKTRIKKNLFFGKIYSQIREDLKSSNPVSDLHTRIGFKLIFFLLTTAVLAVFGAKIMPVENRLEIESAASLKKKKKN